MMQHILATTEDIDALRNEIEYLKRRVAELERINLAKHNPNYPFGNPIMSREYILTFMKSLKGNKDEV